MTATMELVAMARLLPSRPGPDAEPTMNEPPWILVDHELSEVLYTSEKSDTHHRSVEIPLGGTKEVGT